MFKNAHQNRQLVLSSYVFFFAYLLERPARLQVISSGRYTGYQRQTKGRNNAKPKDGTQLTWCTPHARVSAIGIKASCHTKTEYQTGTCTPSNQVTKDGPRAGHHKTMNPVLVMAKSKSQLQSIASHWHSGITGRIDQARSANQSIPPLSLGIAHIRLTAEPHCSHCFNLPYSLYHGSTLCASYAWCAQAHAYVPAGSKQREKWGHSFGIC